MRRSLDKWITDELVPVLDITHVYLQKYCAIEILTLLFFGHLSADGMDRYYENLERLKLYDTSYLIAIGVANVGIVKYCLESINLKWGKMPPINASTEH